MTQGKTIIGLVGMPKAGKGEVVKILQENGFVHQSLSAILADELRELNRASGQSVRVSRSDLTRFGRDLRQQGGADAVAHLAFGRIQNSPRHRHVIDGIRHPDEARFLMSNGVHLWVVCAHTDPTIDYEIRLKRFMDDPQQRGEGFEDVRMFEEMNRMEWNSGEDGGVQVGAAIEMALSHGAQTIINGTEKDLLYRTVDEALALIMTTPEGRLSQASRR